MTLAELATPTKQLRQLCGTVLAMEAIVIGLAIPVAIVMEHLRHGVAGGVGGGLAVCALLLSGLVGRPRMAWALVAGTVLQVLVIAAGVVVPAMYILGVIFAALWITGIWLARRVATTPPGSAQPPGPPPASAPAAPAPASAPPTPGLRSPGAPASPTTGASALPLQRPGSCAARGPRGRSMITKDLVSKSVAILRDHDVARLACHRPRRTA